MRFTIGLPITKIKYLNDTLNSIAIQTFSDFELIIRNNASSKDLKIKIKEICSPWLERKNVQYFESDEQLNISVNFNRILEAATGEYLVIMSDDDIMDQDFLKEFDCLISNHPYCGIYHCRVKIIDENSNLITFTENCPEWEPLSDFIFQRFDNKRALFLSDFVVSIEKLRKLGGFVIMPLGWGMDELTWYKLGGDGFLFTPRVLLSYRISRINFSQSKQNLSLRFKDLLIIHKELEKIINSTRFQEDSIYPKNLLLEKNELRLKKMKEDVLFIYSESSNSFQLFDFYIKNFAKYHLPFRSLIKVLKRKILF
jgi:glycosyltransferase involved in cell wall biosynthesis